MRRASRITAIIALVLTSLSLAGCNGNVVVGVSVGVPVGSHGYVSVGRHWH